MITSSLIANSQVKQINYYVNVSNNNGNIFSLSSILKKSKILLNNNKNIYNIIINLDEGSYELQELLAIKNFNIKNESTLSIIGKDKQKVKITAGKGLLVNNVSSKLTKKDYLIFLNNCKNILFKNITIEGGLGDGVGINNASNISFIGCKILNVGGWALKISNSKNITIQSCDISATGKGGICIQSKEHCKNLVYNNYIHDLNKSKFSKYPAVEVICSGNTLKNNLFTNIPNEAILIKEGNNLIEYNEFVNCSFNSTTGVVYSKCINSNFGNVIKFNYLHDNKKLACGGIFLNNYQNIDTIYGNIFKNVDNALSISNQVKLDLTNNLFINCNSVFVSRPSLISNNEIENLPAIKNSVNFFNKIVNNIIVGGFWDVNSFDLQPTTDSLFYTNQLVENNLFDFTTRINKKANSSSFIVNVNYTKSDLINPFYDNFNIESSNFPKNFKYIQIPFEQIGINIKQWGTSMQ